MPTETQDQLPSEGGRYFRQPDGSLLRTDQAVPPSDDPAPAEQPAPTQE